MQQLALGALQVIVRLPQSLIRLAQFAHRTAVTTIPISLPVCEMRGVQFIDTGTVDLSPARRKNS